MYLVYVERYIIFETNSILVIKYHKFLIMWNEVQNLFMKIQKIQNWCMHDLKQNYREVV